jgi:hypothetical protein
MLLLSCDPTVNTPCQKWPGVFFVFVCPTLDKRLSQFFKKFMGAALSITEVLRIGGE